MSTYNLKVPHDTKTRTYHRMGLRPDPPTSADDPSAEAYDVIEGDEERPTGWFDFTDGDYFSKAMKTRTVITEEDDFWDVKGNRDEFILGFTESVHIGGKIGLMVGGRLDTFVGLDMNVHFLGQINLGWQWRYSWIAGNETVVSNRSRTATDEGVELVVGKRAAKGKDVARGSEQTQLKLTEKTVSLGMPNSNLVPDTNPFDTGKQAGIFIEDGVITIRGEKVVVDTQTYERSAARKDIVEAPLQRRNAISGRGMRR